MSHEIWDSLTRNLLNDASRGDADALMVIKFLNIREGGSKIETADGGPVPFDQNCGGDSHGR